MMLIVVPPKRIDLSLRVLERREPMQVQTFFAESSVEGFDGVVRRCTPTTEVEDHAAGVRPQVHRRTDELGAVVAIDPLRQTALKAQPLDGGDDITTTRAWPTSIARHSRVKRSRTVSARNGAHLRAASPPAPVTHRSSWEPSKGPGIVAANALTRRRGGGPSTGSAPPHSLSSIDPLGYHRSMTLWYANDAFWRENYEVMFSEDAFRRAAEDAERVLSLTGTNPHKVLDLCCGPGRYVVPLAKRGIDVTGVDLSPFLLTKARENAAAAGVTAEFVHSDMRQFVRAQTFDAVLNLYSSFGYFANRDEDAHVLDNMFESLRPGGAAVIDVLGKELLGRRGDRITDLPDGAICIQRIRVADEWNSLDSEFILIRSDSTTRHQFTHRLYSGFELRSAMETAGFKVSLFGDFSGTAYDANAARLVAVGRKPIV